MAQNEPAWNSLMMPKKILIPLYENDVAPRFDMATEVLIVSHVKKVGPADKRMVVLPRASVKLVRRLKGLLYRNVTVLPSSSVMLVGLPQVHQVKLWLSPVGATIRLGRRLLPYSIEATLPSGSVTFDSRPR